MAKSATRTSDEKWIREIAKQDLGNEDNDWGAHGDPNRAIAQWYREAAQGGDLELCQTIDRLGRATAAKLYAAARRKLERPVRKIIHD